MQFRGRPPVVGVVYDTTMSRPDAALALALLYGFEGKREARIASIAVTENSLGAAAFADSVFRFYQLGPLPNANRVLPIGLAADKPLPPDSAMVKAVLERVNEKGEPAYARGIRRVSDTAEVTALMRNSLAYFEDQFVAVVLSAPATYLARILDYAGTRELIKSKVRTMIVSECRQDVAAMRRVLAEWPTPVVFCGREVGEALPYPGSSIDADFAWTNAHPVVDFYRAAGVMPYDTPSQDLAAVLHAVRPDSGLFRASEEGAIEVLDDGGMRFTPSVCGKHKRLIADPAKKDEIVTVLRGIVSAKPVPPPPRRQFTPAEFEKLRKEREEQQRLRELEEKKKTAVKPAASQ
jgi:hypothetical protein